MTDEEIEQAWENPLTDEMRKRNMEKAKEDYPKMFELLTGVKYEEGMNIADYIYSK